MNSYKKYNFDRQTKLTYNDTKMLHGLSVLAMVILHLFDRLDYNSLYTPLLYLWEKPIIFYIAQLSDFCVMGFAFCSGYSLYKQFSKSFIKKYYRARLKSLCILMINYWLILFIFTAISIAMGNGKYMPGSIDEFISNFTIINTTYNGAWWYLFIYIILVISSPLIFICCDKMPIWLSGVGLLVIYLSAYYVRFYMGSANWIFTKYGLLGMTMFEFCIGVYFFKLNWLEIINTIKMKMPKWLRRVISTSLVLGMLIGHTLIIPSVFVAPFTGLIIITLFSVWDKPRVVKTFFMVLGKHATNIWLIHMFFYLYIFKNLVYVGRYPLIILGIILGICIVCSVLINVILRQISMYIKK